MRLNGAFGEFEDSVTPVIRVNDSAFNRATYYPIYVHELGKGRIVHCCYATFDVAKNISDSVGPEFVMRSIKWLAHRLPE
jgi:hypothetical protein